jgi:hypothetical protein
MKTILTTAAALALAAAFSVPALAQQANEQAAVKRGGQCAFSQAMLQAMADGKQEHRCIPQKGRPTADLG